MSFGTVLGTQSRTKKTACGKFLFKLMKTNELKICLQLFVRTNNNKNGTDENAGTNDKVFIQLNRVNH